VAYQPIRDVSQVPRRVLSRPDRENRVGYAGVDDAGQTFAGARRATNHREPIEGRIGMTSFTGCGPSANRWTADGLRRISAKIGKTGLTNEQPG